MSCDFQALFESFPGCVVALAPDAPRFPIVAVTDAYLRLTRTRREEIVGRGIFEVLPDILDDPSGVVSNLRASLERVLEQRRPDAMAAQRHAIRRPAAEGGGFEERHWSALNSPVLDKDGAVLYILHRVEDVTALARSEHEGGERKQTDSNQALLADILQILNQRGDLQSLVYETLHAIREATGFDAVGLRLRQGEDCPYFEQDGFSEDFLREENFLCERGGDGAILCDEEGRVVLECTCGLVLSGRTDPTMACFTEGGSFWTNVSTELLALPLADDPRINPRNRCIHIGYQSVGLFPVRCGEEIVGLLQLNDRREGRFTPAQIAFYEALAQNIGLALQRTMAQEALRESEHFYRQTLESIPGMVFTTRPDGYCDYQSQQWVDFTGVPMVEHLGDGWNKLLHPDDRPRAYAAWRAAVEERAPYDTEYRVRRHDGQYEWFKVRGAPIRDAQGKIVRWFGVAANIDAIKRGEEAASESKARLDLALHSARMGAWELDLKAKKRKFDEQVCHCLGIDPAKFAGTAEEFYGTVHPDDREGLKAALLRTIETGVPYETEYRVVWPDGSLHHISARARRVCDENGEPERILGLVWEITEHKRAEEALRRAVENLARSNKDLQHFAYVASHDLQEPLRTIRSYLQFIEKRFGADLDSEMRELFGFVTDGAARLQDLILDLLAYSRVTNTEAVFVSTDSGKALEGALKALAEAIQDSGAKVTSDPLPRVKADLSQLSLLFQNLIGNAIKFARMGESPRIHVSARENGGQWLFSVSDNGIGIAEKYYQRIFTIFQRLHTSVEYKGSGVGLAICKRIVERHGGEICVDSKEGQGSTFYFTLAK